MVFSVTNSSLLVVVITFNRSVIFSQVFLMEYRHVFRNRLKIVLQLPAIRMFAYCFVDECHVSLQAASSLFHPIFYGINCHMINGTSAYLNCGPLNDLS
jgi:hypothetical protein